MFKDNSKTERLLYILQLLSGNIRYSINQISERFNVSPRTVFRDINTLRNVGFVIDCTADGFYSLSSEDKNNRMISDLLHFSKEEATILYRAINSIDTENELKDILVKKLYSVYKFKRVADTTLNTKRGLIVNSLADAIEGRKQVMIHRYFSPNSETCADRLIEPYRFTTNYVHLWAYDVNDKSCKMFKIARMEAVSLLSQDWEHSSEHEHYNTDPFRISSKNDPIRIKLMLNMRSYRLMIEEYPLTETMIYKEKNHWIFEGDVQAFEGVGRFVLGLPEDVEVIGPPDFIEYLREKAGRRIF